MKTLITLIFISTLVIAQNNQIILDEKFDDWNNTQIFVEDLEDNLSEGVDYKKLWITNDDNYLFLRIDFYHEILIQEDTSTVILINTDDNYLTGSQEYNSGAEIKYIFGKHYGYFYYNNDSIQIFQNDINLISAPTVSSSSYEICFALNSIIDSIPIFSSNEIGIKFVNHRSNLDKIPNVNNLLSYTIQRNLGYTYPEVQIDKENPSSIRVVSYNVHKDDIFKEENFQSFTKIFNTINPDIIAFQEIYDHSSEEVATLMEQFLPSSELQNWYHSKIESVDTSMYNKVDVLVVSRYPIIKSYRIQGLVYSPYGIDKANSAHLIDLPNSAYNLLLVNAHPPCCQSNYYREIELQEIMSFIRDAKTSGGEIDLALNTPIIIAGDMNLVGPSHQKHILINGDMIDNETYGEDFNPDWDETSFADVKPFTTGYPGIFTWYSELNPYNPGRLDYLIYSDYTLQLENSYTLFTKTLSEETLQSYNLFPDDVITASDHLPLVADFSLKDVVDVKEYNDAIPNKYELYQNYPNPFNPTTAISYTIPTSSHVSVNIFDVLGNLITTLVNKNQKAGSYRVTFNASSLSNGIYFYKISAGEFTFVKKMVLLK